MKRNSAIIHFLSILISLFFLLQSAPLSAAEMEDYCIIPPYVKRDVKPNILLLLDNSENMGNPAYPVGEAYDPANQDTYIGLFNPNLMYTYGSNRWEPDDGSVTADPNSDGLPGVYSGELLNWATTSQYDLLESILLGGKSTSRITNINTLLSVSGAWTKRLEYEDSFGRSRVCLFIVNSANVEISDEDPGSCGYLDEPTPYPFISALETNTKYASHEIKKKDQNISSNILDKGLQKVASLLKGIMNFLVPEAEAAAGLRLTSKGALPDGTECSAYSPVTISTSGGTETAPYAWSINTGSLPATLSIDPTGTVPSTTISGNVTAPSSEYNFTIKVCDSDGCINKHMDEEAFSITINDAPVEITTTSMPDGFADTPQGPWYREQIFVDGPCVSSTTWSIASGSLPPGLSLDVSGTDYTYVSGYPTTDGTYNFTVQVTDSMNNTTTKELSITIHPALVGGLAIITSSPLADVQNGQYANIIFSTNISSACTACCGVGCGWSWSITSGSIPPGMTFETGNPFCVGGDHTYLYGAPTTSETYNFEITVHDCTGSDTVSKAFTLTVTDLPPSVRTTGNLDVKICAGTYAMNCNNAPVGYAGPPCSESHPTRCVLKSGIVDQFWPQARFGIEDFSKIAGEAEPNITNCIEANPGAYPDENFLTAIENAVPIPPITTLVNGMYDAIDYYANNTAVNCDPFRNSNDCQKNFTLMLTAGAGADNPPEFTAGPPDVLADATNCDNSDYANLSKNTCFGYNNDLRNNPEFGAENLPGRQYLSTYIVNTMGEEATTGVEPGTCDPEVAPSTNGDILCQAANVGGGSYYEVTDPAQLRAALIQAFKDIIKRAAAGTAASVLASGEGSGANLIQAVFYPRRKFRGTEVAWIGRLTNFWYYIDPRFSQASIHEDNASSQVFNLTDDNKVNFYFDTINELTMAYRYEDSNNDGLAETLLTPDIVFEDLSYLWEAGIKLWQRDISPVGSPRTIFTHDGSSVVAFSTAQASTLAPFLDLETVDNDGDSFLDGDLDHDGDVDDDDASILIRYIHGEDFTADTWMRDRTVSIDINGNDTIDAGETRVWKLSDILNSTPKISSWIPLNKYYDKYKDTSYKNFTESATYTNRGLVFAGGNDGMLHAFYLGDFELDWAGRGTYEKARLTGSNLGREEYAFIPKNALPYLKYIKQNDYCHVYTVDASPYIFDASINAPAGCVEADDAMCDKDVTSWRTILIGGMRFGGACKNTCLTTDCIETPVTNLGYSSYFAIDITNQANPQFLWEFSNEDLGLATTGPSIVRVGDSGKNGDWFVVLGSGPTGPISTSDQQFLGRSDQNLRFFVLDVKTGTLLRTIDTGTLGIQNAFAGSMINVTTDVDLDYKDDALYVGYVEKCTDGTNPCTVGNWEDGGVVRIQIKEDDNINNWVASQLIDGVGAVTSSVTRLINPKKGKMWIFFGSGRYYFEQLATVDDQDNQRTLYGLLEPCYDTTGYVTACASAFSGPITDVTAIADATEASIADGWKIDLDATGDYTYVEGGSSVTREYRAERVITDPLATSQGLVFFTSYKPYNDVCAYGGKSFIWAVKYDTGGAPNALLKGIALLQVSTGSIEQIDLSSSFTEKGGRRTSALEGVPPTAQGLSLLTTPPPIKRIIHIRER